MGWRRLALCTISLLRYVSYSQTCTGRGAGCGSVGVSAGRGWRKLWPPAGRAAAAARAAVGPPEYGVRRESVRLRRGSLTLSPRGSSFTATSWGGEHRVSWARSTTPKLPVPSTSVCSAHKRTWSVESVEGGGPMQGGIARPSPGRSAPRPSGAADTCPGRFQTRDPWTLSIRHQTRHHCLFKCPALLEPCACRAPWRNLVPVKKSARG
jgi:hypothetical protein